MLRVEGPVVAQNQMLFASDWLTENPDTSPESFYYNTKPQPDGFAAQVFADGPTQRRGATPQFLGALISQAQHTLIISTPYFIPDYSLINILCATAYRGVAVAMIFPKHNDSFVVAATSRSYYWQLLEAGVKIYEYKPGLLHAKTLTVDGELSLIGSTNLDLRSFDLI
ncbi:phosphatidylserine/phosphatidylglycerophosphate/cardiolipin synthase-like enzyme [Psychrobacter sp. PL15]|uniref:phospholipase D-like domain-containing protein n=1 Tax=Psychrobacter sp. PL15 TaxID=3071719 RepID=UPI002E0BF146|nr:phosphatidylserine/phosphatidylglycerophosphate/cardiolipin synthase-like enzyme [Psychrobacter sp. PL15]